MIKAYTDGACRGSNPGVCSCAFAVYDDDKLVNSCGFFLGDEYSNNYAEYQGLIHLLEWYSGSTVPMEIYSDSMLVVLQVNKVWGCEKEDLIPLRDKAQQLIKKGKHTLYHVKGHSGVEGNELADKLCNEVLDSIKKHKELEKAIKNLETISFTTIAVSSYYPIMSGTCYALEPFRIPASFRAGVASIYETAKETFEEEKKEFMLEKAKAELKKESGSMFKDFLEKMYPKKSKF